MCFTPFYEKGSETLLSDLSILQWTCIAGPRQYQTDERGDAQSFYAITYID